MNPNINTSLINKKLLEEAIESLERGYIDGVVSLVQTPIFIKLCQKALDETDNKERKEQLQKTIEQHNKTVKTVEESMQSLALIIPQIKQLGQ